MSDAVAWLRRLLPRLSELGADGERLAEAIRRARADPNISIEQAAALPPNWRAVANLVERDEALRSYANRYLAKLSLRQQADEILQAAGRLRASGANLRRVATGADARADLAKLLLAASVRRHAHRDALPTSRQVRRVLGHLPPTANGPRDQRDSIQVNRRQP